MTVLEQMAEWIAAGGDDLLPQSVRQRLATHLLDTVGAWIGGSATDEGKMLTSLASSPEQPLSLLARKSHQE
jgi:hypothetical protein